MGKSNNFNKNLFFIDISIKLFLFSFLARFFNWHIYVFDNFGGSPTQIKILQKMHKLKWITRVTEQFYAINNSHSVAIKLADKIVNNISNDNSIQLVRKLYNSEETDLVFKKSIARHLSLLSSINQYILSKNHIINPTIFVNVKYGKILKENLNILDESITVKNCSYLEYFKLKFKLFITIMAYQLHLVAQLFYKINKDKKIYKYGISVPFSWAKKFKGPREFTFIVDNSLIKKSETIFLIEYPENKIFYQHYSKAGYNLIDANNIKTIKKLFDKSDIKFANDFLIIIKLLFVKKSYFFIYEALTYLLYSRMSYSITYAKVLYKNYIYFNKESALQIAANIFLKEKKIKTHAYTQFIGGQYQICGENSIHDNRNALWSFLNPDYYYLNNKAMHDSMLLHYHHGVQHKVIGNVFSEKIMEIRKDCQYILSIKSRHNISKERKVITIFDTSYVDVKMAISNFEEACNFLLDSIRLAKSMPECIFLFKPSKDNSYFLSGFWAFEDGIEVIKLRQRFNKLSNGFMLSDNIDVIELISASDVVFTNCFSSPTADALLAGVPAFWYQSRTDVSFSVYNKVPNLVIVGFKNLNVLVNKIIEDDYSLDILNDPDFINLVGSNTKALTSLRLKINK